MRRDVFQAIADPTRREIISLLSGATLNLNAVADNFKISRPAISRHIKILNQCGLLNIQRQGRERYCEANLKSLSQVFDWVDQYRVFWTGKLNALEQFLEKEKKTNSKTVLHKKTSIARKATISSKNKKKTK